ncbi:GNAT family N-acetyltransferase [Paraburkholderia sp. A1BS-2L]|uniref:GNAT family N-acetyltransferase n=1 Tax=Paraburkholderia sp. A1BS-2L TaxID=3028373 RepID=UPI003DA80267
MNIHIVEYDPEHAQVWDDWCGASDNATLLHTRRFLSYHGDRFEDASVLLFDDQRLTGVFPAARVTGDAHSVVSHPGATYGGIAHDGRLQGQRMIDAIGALKSHYRDRHVRKLVYKLVPFIYARVPAQDDVYALFRHGAQRVRCDLSCAIDLSHQRPVSERRRRARRKAHQVVTLGSTIGELRAFWSVLGETLARRHEAVPVHTFDEIALLVSRFPNEIQLRCAFIEGQVVAGVLFFNSTTVWHAQYIASSERGNQVSALDAVFDAAIEEARTGGARYFDFGTSNESAGTVLNDGLYRFKSEFGGGGVAHEFYELTI